MKYVVFLLCGLFASGFCFSQELKTVKFNGETYYVFPYFSEVNTYRNPPDISVTAFNKLQIQYLDPPPLSKKMPDGKYLYYEKSHNKKYPDAAGILVSSFSIKNGAYNGKIIYYSINGKPRLVGFMKNNKKDSLWKSIPKYSYKASLIELEFRNDLPNGKGTVYYHYRSWKNKLVKWDKKSSNLILNKSYLGYYILSLDVHNGSLIKGSYSGKKGIEFGKLQFLNGEFSKCVFYSFDKIDRKTFQKKDSNFLVREKVSENDSFTLWHYEMVLEQKKVLEYDYWAYKNSITMPIDSSIVEYYDGHGYSDRFYNMDYYYGDQTNPFFVSTKSSYSMPDKYHRLEAAFYVNGDTTLRTFVNGKSVAPESFEHKGYKSSSAFLKNKDNTFIIDTITNMNGKFIVYKWLHYYKSAHDIAEYNILKNSWYYYSESEKLPLVLLKKDTWLNVGRASTKQAYPEFKKDALLKDRLKNLFRQGSISARYPSILKKGTIQKDFKNTYSDFVYTQYIVKNSHKKYRELNSVVEVGRKDSAVQYEIVTILDKKEDLVLRERVWCPKVSGEHGMHLWKSTLSYHLLTANTELKWKDLNNFIDVSVWQKGKELKDVELNWYPSRLKKRKYDTQVSFNQTHPDSISQSSINVLSNYYTYINGKELLDSQCIKIVKNSRSKSTTINNVVYVNGAREGAYALKEHSFYINREGEVVHLGNTFKDTVWYKAGKLSGNLYFFRGKMELKNGVPNGVFQANYHLVDSLHFLGNYKNGVPHGKFIEFDTYGDTLMELDFENGEINHSFIAKSNSYNFNSIDSIYECTQHKALDVQIDSGSLKSISYYFSNGLPSEKFKLLSPIKYIQYSWDSIELKRSVGWTVYPPQKLKYLLTRNNSINNPSWINCYPYSSSLKPMHVSYTKYYQNGALALSGESKWSTKKGEWYFGRANRSAFLKVLFLNKDSLVDGLSAKAELIQYKENGGIAWKGLGLKMHSSYDCDVRLDVETFVPYIPDYAKFELQDSQWMEIRKLDGSLACKGYLIRGVPHGLWQFYGKSDALVEIGSFDKGILEGVWLSGDLVGFHIPQNICMAPGTVITNYMNTNSVNILRKYYVKGKQVEEMNFKLQNASNNQE